MLRVFLKGADSDEVLSHVVLSLAEVANLSSVGPLDVASKSELLTDAAVRKKDISHLSGRDLQSASAWLDPSTSTGTEASDPGLSGSGKNWNQFEVNQKLFNVRSTFDEALYTSKLDMTKMTREQLDFADRMAKEIESQQSDNFHLQEERGQAQERGDLDEEDLYSGVLGSRPSHPHGSNKDADSNKSVVNAVTGAWKKGLKVSSGSPAPQNAVVANPPQGKKGSGSGSGSGRNVSSPNVPDSGDDNVWRRRAAASPAAAPQQPAQSKLPPTTNKQPLPLPEGAADEPRVARSSSSGSTPPPGFNGGAGSSRDVAESAGATDARFTTPSKGESLEQQATTQLQAPSAAKVPLPGPSKAADGGSGVSSATASPANISSADGSSVPTPSSEARTPPPPTTAAVPTKPKSKFTLNAGAAEFKPSFVFTPSPSIMSTSTPTNTPSQTPSLSHAGTPAPGGSLDTSYVPLGPGGHAAPHQTPVHGQPGHGQPQAYHQNAQFNPAYAGNYPMNMSMVANPGMMPMGNMMPAYMPMPPQGANFAGPGFQEMMDPNMIPQQGQQHVVVNHDGMMVPMFIANQPPGQQQGQHGPGGPGGPPQGFYNGVPGANVVMGPDGSSFGMMTPQGGMYPPNFMGYPGTPPMYPGANAQHMAMANPAMMHGGSGGPGGTPQHAGSRGHYAGGNPQQYNSPMNSRQNANTNRGPNPNRPAQGQVGGGSVGGQTNNYNNNRNRVSNSPHHGYGSPYQGNNGGHNSAYINRQQDGGVAGVAGDNGAHSNHGDPDGPAAVSGEQRTEGGSNEPVSDA
jgi:hypothetical protein